MAKHSKKEKSAKTPARTAAIVLSVLAALLLLAAAGALLFWRMSERVQGSMFRGHESAALEKLHDSAAAQTEPTATPAPEAPDWVDANGNGWLYRDDLVTMLLIGVDYMADESLWDDGTTFNGGNSDVLALAVLDPATSELTLLYIPRDTMADIIMLDPQGDYLRTVNNNISAAHSYGDGGALSCELTVDAVSNLLYGIPIDRYAALSYDAIPVMNELLGGIQITFERDYTEIDRAFTAGTTLTLTDNQLKNFITRRDHAELSSAFARGQRQMQLLKAMFAQCKDAFSQDVSFPVRLFWEARDYITTDLSATEITYLARQVFAAGFDDDTVVTLRGEMTAGEKYAEYLADEEWLLDFVTERFCVPAQ